MHTRISNPGTIHYHAEPKSQFANHVHRQLQIVQTKGRRLRYEHYKIAILDRFDDRT